MDDAGQAPTDKQVLQPVGCIERNQMKTSLNLIVIPAIAAL